MAIITLKGKAIRTNGELPKIGQQAPDFRLVDGNLNDVNLSTYRGKKKLLSIVPSLDTATCAISTRKFHEYAKSRKEVIVLIISADLPFAQKRFCQAEGIDNVITLSMMRSHDFARDYGVLIQDGPLEGIAARAVVVLDDHDHVVYTQLVKEVADEPDYEKALAAL